LEIGSNAREGPKEGSPGKGSSESHDFVTTKYHRMQIRARICRSAGEYTPRVSSALVTLGPYDHAGKPKTQCHERHWVFCCFDGSVAETA
jgi:hypothetical protein